MTVVASNVRFVLVEPREPGNIGASARALKNMGFRGLVRVKGASIHHEEARQMAVTASDVLDESRQLETIADAIQGAVLVAATTKRGRGAIQPRPMFLRPAVQMLLDAAKAHPVAILFGNEKWGLSHEELAPAGMIVRIPTDPSFGSLNLAQSVLLVAYELRMAMLEQGLMPQPGLTTAKRKLATADDLQRLYESARKALVANRFFPPHRVENGMNTLRGIFSRARLEQREVQFLLGMFGRLMEEPPDGS